MRYLIILLVLASCRAPKPLADKAKAQKYLTKIERLDPSILSKKTDTIFIDYLVSDTVYLPQYLTDTVFNYLPGDTVFLVDSSGASVRVIFLPGNRAGVVLNTPAKNIVFTDTIKVASEISNQTIIDKRPVYTWLMNLWRTSSWIIILCLIVVGTLVIMRFIK